CYFTAVFQAICRAPPNLAIFNPVFVDGIPFVATKNLSYPMAALIIIIGNFFYKAHKLGEIIKVREKRIDLVYRRFNCNGSMMFCHTIFLLSYTDVPVL